MPSSEANPWVTRWRYEMEAKPIRPGIFRLREGGFFVRARAMDPRTGKDRQRTAVLVGEGRTLAEAIEAQARLRSEARSTLEVTKPSVPHWSDYAVSLFEAKVTEGRLKSPKTREWWNGTLMLLIPVFGRILVNELRYADIVAWRDQLARWMRDGMPSRRKRDEGRLVKLSASTANGWISILKVICAAMTKHYELARDPAKAVEFFRLPRTYTREQPNALDEKQVPIFLEKMKELHPQHLSPTLCVR